MKPLSRIEYFWAARAECKEIERALEENENTDILCLETVNMQKVLIPRHRYLVERLREMGF